MILRVLILGSSRIQEEAVKYLKGTGCWVATCSFRSSDRINLDTDRFALIDVRDAEAVKKFAQAENVELIYSIGSDFAAETAAKVSTELGLPTFVSRSTIEIVRDKERLRNFLNENDLGAVKFKKVEHIDDSVSCNVFPSIVKPTDNQGQRGVSYVRSRSELISCLEIFKHSQSNCRGVSRRPRNQCELFFDQLPTSIHGNLRSPGLRRPLFRYSCRPSISITILPRRGCPRSWEAD